MSEIPEPTSPKPKKPARPFRGAVFRGLAIALPPLLTVVIFLWIWGTLETYIINPVEGLARSGIVHGFYSNQTKIVEADPGAESPRTKTFDDATYRRVGESDRYVRSDIYKTVRDNRDGQPMPETPDGIYHAYVKIQHLRPQYVVPFLLCVFILLMYSLGKFMAAGAGRFFIGLFERAVNALPLVRNVYSSVKQVTDFMLTERDIEYTRVVALEYPRNGIWSIGFVTGDCLVDVHMAANEPMVSVLIPTSPMPVTGYTVMVKRSEILDLDLTIDQTLQFIVSCGVVVAEHQLPNEKNMQRIRKAASNDAGRSPQDSIALPGTLDKQ
jgi:uncharacterized membrane protein